MNHFLLPILFFVLGFTNPNLAQPMANHVPKGGFGETIMESKSLACGDMVFSLQVINNGSGCCYRLLADNSNPDDCYMNISLTLNAGEFTNFTHLSGWQHNTGGPAEYTVRPFFGFVPFGLNMIAEFCVEGAPSPTLTLQWSDFCSMEGCTADFVVNACYDPGNASIIGVKYRECGSLPYTNQATIPDWTMQLFNEAGDLIAEQVTNAGGAYAFYDLPKGIYVVKETQQPGWTANVPASGQTTVDLSVSEQEVRDFGNCPSCSCDSIDMEVISSLWHSMDTCAYIVAVQNAGGYCFDHITIDIGSGKIASWMLMEPGWEVVPIDTQHLRLNPPGGFIPLETSYPLKINATGSAEYTILMSSFYNNGNGPVECKKTFVYQCPLPTGGNGQSCCPAGSVPGPELVTNGDFEAGNTGFTTGPPALVYSSVCTANTYVVDNNLTVKCSSWPSLFDHTFGNASGHFMAIDGNNSVPGPFNVWNSTVAVVPGTKYCFSFWAASVQSQFFGLGFMINGVQIPPAALITQATPTWTYYSVLWTCPAGVGPTVPIAIRQLSAGTKRDFGLDDVSFRACLSPTCTVVATTVKLDNCGSVELTATPTGVAPFTYLWSNLQTTPVINVQQPCGSSTYTVTVTCANNSTSTAKVTVVFADNTLPTVTCPGNLSVQGFVDNLGFCRSFVNNIGAVAADNCPGLSLTYAISAPTGGSGSNDASGTVFQQGTSTVTYTATDWCGNKASCSFSVTVECHNCICAGTQGPELVTNGNFNSLTPISSSYNYDCTNPQPGFYCVTTNPALVNAAYAPCVDVSGTGGMLVANGSSPSTEIWCQVFNNLTPNTNYIFTYWVASVTATSPAQIQLYLNSAPYGSLGQANVNPCLWRQYCQVWNSGNNTSVTLCLKDVNTTATGNDFALDEISFRACPSPPPCQASFTITPINNCGLVQLTGTSTGPPTIGYQWYNSVSTPNQQVQLSCGLNTICVTVTCGDGSTSTACQNYVVSDPIPPVALCKLPISLDLDPNCTFQVTPAFVDNGSSDNCFIDNLSVSPAVLPSCATTTVTLTVTDWCGNTSTCTMDIQTAESTPPVINNCPQSQIVPMDPGVCTYTFTPPVLSVTDNCDPNPALNCTWEDPNGTILPITGPVQMPKGANQILCKAIDNCGNESAPCIYVITVGDYESPTIICPQNLTVQGVITNNICEAVVSNIAPIATDNCPIQSLVYYITPSGNTGMNDASGETFPQGVSTVAYVVTDCGGFTNACFFTVTVDCSCGPTCLTNSVDISTGHQDQAAAGILVPGHINQNWRLKSAPSGSGLTNFDFPGHMLKHSSWTQFGSTWMSAYLFNDLTVLNGSPGSGGIPFVYERTFCVCEDGDVNFNFQFWSDDCGKVELISPSGAIMAVLVDNCTTPTTPNNWTTPTASSTLPYFLTSGSGPYKIRISHWNTTGLPMGVNLLGTISGSNLGKDECCDPQEACFLIRKFENVPNGQPYYEWDQSNDWTSYDKPLSGWYFNISNGTNSYGPFGPSDILGEVLVCNLPVGLPGPFYSTTEVIQPGWTITYSNTQPQTLVDHHVQVMEFGNTKDTDCGCGTFSLLNAAPVVFGSNVQLTCGGPPVNLDWAIGSDIYITGKLQCQGTCLPNEWVSFSLTTPNGSVYVGGTQSHPYFVIGLLPVWYSTPGLYTLTLQGYCGGNSCTPCVIQFQIGNPDPCPCDPVDFQSDLSQGFATTYATTSCVGCFTPIALNDCDIVHWSFNGGPIVGTTYGKQTFCYNFTSGIHTVTMTVTRKDGDGNKCDQGSFTQSVNITCGVRAACDVSNFPNPGFSEGAVAGGINSTGASSGWYGPCGEPVVVSGEPGSHDGWTILLTGNRDSADVLAPLDAGCIYLDSGTISLRFGIREKGIKSALHIELYQGPVFEMNDCNGSACIDLATIDLSPLDTGWQDLELPYNISDWGALDTCGGNGAKARLAIFVTNAIGNNQGGPAETKSSVQVDNICLPNGCNCGSFSDLFARPSVGAPSIQLFCGDTYNFGCPKPGKSIPITGKFECLGGNCLASSQINWTLTGPNNFIANGSVQAGPYFYLPIPPLSYAQSGTYTLVLKGNCGGTDCPPCVIHFTVDCPNPCPCDEPQFQKDVAKGFATALWATTCKGCFSPISLTDCDMVSWSINGGPVIAITNGSQSFCHIFPSAGTYTVTMIVSRKKSDGSPCKTFTFSKSVTVTCIIKDPCDVSVFPNSAFSEGAVAGGLNSGGASKGWKGLYGDPQVLEGQAGSSDGWAMLLSGHVDAADVMSHDSSKCLEKGSGVLTMTMRGPISTSRSNIKRISVFVNRNESYVFNVFNSDNCYLIAELDISDYDSSWVDLEIPYDLSTWIALDTCGDVPHGVNVRPLVYVTSPFESTQGGDETRTCVAIDHLCYGSKLVGIEDLPYRKLLRIFPNPNPGIFTVELPEPAKLGITFRITDLAGRLVQEQKTEPGSVQQIVRAGVLPAGLYFLQVVSEGKVLAVEKFVKQ